MLATQNPIESDGTYPLPEAQLDRFMFKVVVDYPSYDDELVVVQRVTGPAIELRTVLTPGGLLELQRQVEAVYVDPRVVAYAATLVDATRKPAAHGLPRLADAIEFGASPRASINLVAAARALAFLRGRTYALATDVEHLAHEVLRHRLVLAYESIAAGGTADAAITRDTGATPRAACWTSEIAMPLEPAALDIDARAPAACAMGRRAPARATSQRR